MKKFLSLIMTAFCFCSLIFLMTSCDSVNIISDEPEVKVARNFCIEEYGFGVCYSYYSEGLLVEEKTIILHYGDVSFNTRVIKYEYNDSKKMTGMHVSWYGESIDMGRYNTGDYDRFDVEYDFVVNGDGSYVATSNDIELNAILSFYDNGRIKSKSILFDGYVSTQEYDEFSRNTKTIFGNEDVVSLYYKDNTDLFANKIEFNTDDGAPAVMIENNEYGIASIGIGIGADLQKLEFIYDEAGNLSSIVIDAIEDSCEHIVCEFSHTNDTVSIIRYILTEYTVENREVDSIRDIQVTDEDVEDLGSCVVITSLRTDYNVKHWHGDDQPPTIHDVCYEQRRALFKLDEQTNEYINVTKEEETIEGYYKDYPALYEYIQGELSSVSIYNITEKDSKGNNIKYTLTIYGGCFNEASIDEVYAITHTYDENSNPVTVHTVDQESGDEIFLTNKYDEDGNLIETYQEKYSADGVKQEHSTTVYVGDTTIHTTYFYANEQVVYYIVNTESGGVTTTQCFNKDGEEISTGDIFPIPGIVVPQG